MDNNLTNTDKVQELQRKLYLKAKSEVNFRFYALYDKIYRKDVLIRTWQKVKTNHGSPGIDGITIEDIEEEGAPLIKPILATVAMILFLNSWNDFLWPVIIICSKNLRTIPVGLALFKDPYGSMDYGPLMAATVISVGPLLIAYFLSQKFIIKGIAMTGLKG